MEEETTLEADGNAAVLEVQLLPKMRRQEVQPLQRKRRPSHGAAAVDHHADAAQGQEAAQIDPPPPGQSGHDCGLEADGETTPGASASGNDNGSGRQRRATGPSACSRPAVPAGIPAPTTLRSAMQWPARFIQVLPQEAISALRRLRDSYAEGGGLWLSTHYSGVGCSETIANEILQHVPRSGGKAAAGAEKAARELQPAMKVFHACDCDKDCLNYLLNHSACTGAEHIFMDITTRIHPAVHGELHGILQKFRNRATKYAKNHLQQKELAEQCMSDLINHVLQYPMHLTDFCLRHRKMCPLFDVPAQQVRKNGGIIGNMSGPTCTDYSRQHRNNPGGLGLSSIPWAVWAAERKLKAERKEEDWVFHECVPGLPAAARLQQLCPSHLVVAFTLSPVLFGVGVRRKRTYTLAIAPWLLITMVPMPMPRRSMHSDGGGGGSDAGPGPGVAEKISDTETSTGVIELGGDAGDSGGGGTATTTTGVINISDGEDMEVSVGDANAANTSMPLWQVGGPAWWFGSRHVSIKGSDFFAATCSMVQRHAKLTWAHKRKRAGAGRISIESDTCGTTFIRLSDYERMVQYQEQFGACAGFRDCIMDLTQSCSYAGQPGEYLPCLLRRCDAIFSSKRQRCMVPEEVLLSQGFPAIRGLADIPMPFDMNTVLATPAAAASLYTRAGNGINFWTGGAVLLWLLAGWQTNQSVWQEAQESEAEAEE